MSPRIFGAPLRYIQGPGTLTGLAGLVAEFGRRPMLVVDPVVADSVAPALSGQRDLEPAVVARFGGECTAAEIDRIAALGSTSGIDVIVGAGGGKAIDTAKGVRIALGTRLVIVPTIASNDSPTSRLAVLYTETHALSEVRLMPVNPDAVLVDTDLIAAAPRRFFVAGIGDALSKKYEAEACIAAGGRNFHGGTPTRLAGVIAEGCHRVLLDHAETAVARLGQVPADPAVEAVIEATILMSGLAFESGGLSIAHALQRGFSAIPALSGWLHGELVALGLLVQLAAANSPDLVPIRSLCGRLGLPTSPNDIGCTGDELALIAETTLQKAPYVTNFSKPMSAEILEEAMIFLNDNI